MSIGDFIDWFPYQDYPNVEVYFDEGAQYINYLGLDGVPAYVVFGSTGDIIYVYDSIPSNEQLLSDLTYYAENGY